MNRTDRFDTLVSDWLHADAEHRVPEHLDAVLRRTSTERQRPAWSSLERWLPVYSTIRVAPVPRIAWLLVVVAIVAALGVAALAIGSRHRQQAPPFGPARNGVIVYGGSDNDIHSLDPVTGAAAVLIGGAAGDHRPLLSPDGTKLLFLRDSTTRDQGVGPFEPMVMVANADGSEVRPLTGAIATFREAAWSHDGSKVAVATSTPTDVTSTATLQVLTVDGSVPPVTIDTHRTYALAYVSFRPMDREITFRGTNGDGDALYRVNIDGTGYLQIPFASQGDDASLSPDGTRIAYQTIDGSHSVIHVVDVDSGVDVIPALDPPASDTFIDGATTWSPDGTRLLFVRYHTGTINRLAIASATGGPVVEIGPEMPNDSTPTVAVFSPDGSSVLAHYTSDGSTWLLDPSGASAGTKLSSTIAQTPTWQRLAP